MSGGVTRFVFRRKREIAEVSAAFDFFRLVEGQHIERRVALDNLFNVFFQQRPNHQGGAILLRLGEQLAYRLAGGVVNFQFRRRVSGGCDHGLRLCGRRGNRLGGRGSGSLRRGGCCRRLGCRFRSRRCLVLRRGLNRIRAASGGGKIADFCLRRTHHIIITGDIRRLGDLGGNRAARHRRRAVFGGFKALLDSAAEDRRLTVQRQKKRNLVGGRGLIVLHVHQRRRQHFGARILRIARLPVFNACFQQRRIVAVVKPHPLQIQPALEGIFIGVDHQRIGLVLGHRGERLPGRINIFLTLFGVTQQRLLGD